jgi:small GTP-binding protein
MDFFSGNEDVLVKEKTEALPFVKRLLSVRESASKFRQIELQIRRVEELLDNASYQGEIELFANIKRLSKRFKLDKYEALLDKRSVVGVGGQFSSGKSCFLNSILGSDYLPEGINPTTSIETYITAGKGEFSVSAYTQNGAYAPLAESELVILTHKLKADYGFSLADVVNNISLNVPNLKYEHIALLDTPGYSKPDSGIVKVSDRERASRMLKSADFLIWLVDAQDGDLTRTDIDFIKMLGVKREILFVVNKADKKNDVSDVVNQVKATAERNQIQMFAVAPYSSQTPDEYGEGKKMVEKYLELCDKAGNESKSLREQLFEVMQELIDNIAARQDDAAKLKKNIGDAIKDGWIMPGNVFLGCSYFEKDYELEEYRADKKAIIDVLHQLRRLLGVPTDKIRPEREVLAALRKSCYS